jgi:hypothetical protein
MKNRMKKRQFYSQHSVMPAYERDDGPLTDEYVNLLKQYVNEHRPLRGRIIRRTSLFPNMKLGAADLHLLKSMSN